MDPIKILRRAWQILWSYRVLWVFGLILALAGAGATTRGPHNRNQYQTEPQSPQQQYFPQDMHQALQQAIDGMQRLFREGLTKAGISPQELTTILWIAGIFILILLVLGVVVAIGRYISETAVIRMVDEYEGTGSKMTLRQGFRLGWSRTSWRLFLINLLVSLPAILAVGLLLLLGIVVFLAIYNGNQQAAIASIVGSIGILFLVIFVVAILSIFLRLLRHFAWRVCALENVGVGESFRRGFQMARENWKSVGVMWLVMVGLGIVWAVVSVIAFIVTAPLVLVTGVVGLLVAAIPALLAGGLTSLLLHGWLPWIIGMVFALPLFSVIAFSPWLLLTGWQTVFTSTVWTLVYRELKAIPALTNGNPPEVPAAS